MSGNIRRSVAALLAISMVVLFVTTDAFAGPPRGANDLSPLTGDATTVFALTPPVGASCTGSGAGVPEYRWQTYLVSALVDASTLTYAGGQEPVTGAIVSPLHDSATGLPVVDQSPSGIPLGLIDGIPTFSFAPLVGTLPAGEFKIGFACTQAGVLDAGNYWETPITISNVTPTGFDYAFGAVPLPPVLATSLTVGFSSLSGSFTPLPSVPTTTGYTVTATPTSGPDPVVTLPVIAGATAFNLTGLVNGTTYVVTVTATNAVGTSAPSNAETAMVNPVAHPGVTSLVGTPGIGLVALTWVAPFGDVGRTGYVIDVSPAVAGSPFAAPAGATTFAISGVTAGTPYTVTVTATYPAPYTGTPVTASGTSQGPGLDQISVIRPVGALVLTQRCGVYGALPALPESPGFGPLSALPASTDRIGTAPLTDLGAADPVFAEYPLPDVPTYPTHCGIDMGTGRLVTSGAFAGQYFSATGRLNQITVVDTRDLDAGFTVNGTVSDFVNGSSNFTGNYLAWHPVVSDDSDPNLDGYDQTVVAGPSVEAVGSTSTAGLVTPKPLAYAVAGQGLGIATLDARLKLLIPVTARSGTYTATITITVI